MTFTGFTIPAAQTIFLVVADYNASSTPTATWGATAMTVDTSAQNSSGTVFSVRIFRLKSAGGGTQDLTITWSGTAPTNTAAIAFSIGGLPNGNNVVAVGSSGTSTGPNPGNIGVNPGSGANGNPVALVTGIATNGPTSDADGTPASGFSHIGDDGDGTNLKLCVIYKITGATGSHATGKTGITSRKWAACAGSYR